MFPIAVHFEILNRPSTMPPANVLINRSKLIISSIYRHLNLLITPPPPPAFSAGLDRIFRHGRWAFHTLTI
jgi:hypothetical protein